MRPLLCAVWALVTVSACAVEPTKRSETPPPAANDALPTPTPISDAPLAGTVGGRAFEGRTAFAAYDSTSRTASIFISDEVRTCADFGVRKVGRRLELVVRWETGIVGAANALAERDGAIAGTSSADLVVIYFKEFVDVGGTTKPDVDLLRADRVNRGRVEVDLASPERTSRGRIRLRASTEEDVVEGAIDVEVCLAR